MGGAATGDHAPPWHASALPCLRRSDHTGRWQPQRSQSKRQVTLTRVTPDVVTSPCCSFVCESSARRCFTDATAPGGDPAGAGMRPQVPLQKHIAISSSQTPARPRPKKLIIAMRDVRIPGMKPSESRCLTLQVPDAQLGEVEGQVRRGSRRGSRGGPRTLNASAQITGWSSVAPCKQVRNCAGAQSCHIPLPLGAKCPARCPLLLRTPTSAAGGRPPRQRQRQRLVGGRVVKLGPVAARARAQETLQAPLTIPPWEHQTLECRNCSLKSQVKKSNLDLSHRNLFYLCFQYIIISLVPI